MTFTGDLAETMVLDAVNFSMNKACKANIIIAGPICSGKMPIAEFVRKYYSTTKNYKITLMNQASFYKSLYGMERFPQGWRIDAPEAFHTEEFVKRVKAVFEKGISSSPYFNLNTWTRGMPEIEKQCTTEEQKKELRSKMDLFTFHSNSLVNIFVGTHAIKLLEDVVPNAITIYLNTDFDVCMKRRLGMECYRKVANIKTIAEKNAYFDFVLDELEWSVYPQRAKADIVLKANEEM